MRGTWVYRGGKLVEKFGPEDVRPEPARSDLPMPMLISDEMQASEHVDGQFYTSKAAYRAVTRANGLTEVGTERPKPRKRQPVSDKAISDAVDKAVADYSKGRRPAA
ncbi:hypothetical protein [Bradyrhizobium sp.]|jgi:hypothetical protein|uniref:hypothetical protein n=1 Tax=Bradyrhizobium sp. TaxID=376 RepID=UPI002DDD9764|nr:hypothetical protein [Bradyrhizobium sp.]HEV2160237.1 hypothetical protein [Bradyrhizobium sp.]